MANFFKENGHTVIKMILYQIVLSMLGGMLALAGSATGSNFLLAGFSIFSILFYLYLISTIFYEMGQKDGIRINAGRLRLSKYKALIIAVCANLINFILGALVVFFKSMINGVSLNQNLSSLTEEQALALTPSWAVNAYESLNTVTKAIQCMYVGVLKVFFSGNVVVLLFIPIPAIITAVIAYRLGVKYCEGFSNSKRKAERYES